MVEQKSLISKAFQVFMKEAPDHARAWGTMVQGLGQASVLDAKTGALAYLAILAALDRPTGIRFHVVEARKAGASRDEVISAVLLGLPAAGHIVTQALPVALEAFDAE
jgi:alkylhydroperoxidase/carboxymuconolactone decarboxylase family protein YurZ